MHKAAIIASEKRIRDILTYKAPIALRKGRRKRITAKGIKFFNSPSKLVFLFKVSDNSRLNAIVEMINVKTDIATVSGTVDKD